MPLSSSSAEIKRIALFLLIHLGLSLILGLIALGVVGGAFGVSFVVGELLIGFSILSLSLSVYLFFLKKNIALLVSVIVLKWPVLIYVVYRVIKAIELDSVAISLGLATIILSALIWSPLQKE